MNTRTYEVLHIYKAVNGFVLEYGNPLRKYIANNITSLKELVSNAIDEIFGEAKANR